MSGNKTCKLCNRNIGKKLKLNCGLCKGNFHLECGKVSEIDARLMAQEKTPWTCEACINQAQNCRRSSIYSVRPRDGEDCLNELKSLIGELREEVRDMRKAMDFISEKYEEERKRNKILEDMLVEISKDNQMLKEKISKLEVVHNINENNKIKNNICITGLIKNSDDKNVANDKLSRLFKHLNVTTSKTDFDITRKFETKDGIKSVVTFAALELKQKILKARSQKGRITVKGAALEDSELLIFISEEMTRETYNLFRKAKRLRDVGYRYIWHRYGKILARKNDGDDLIIIKDESVISDLLS